MKEIICEDYSKKIIWEKSFERDSEERIFDKKKRDEILRQTTRILRISINKTRLFVHVWYFSSLNILSRFSLSNISSSLSNDFSQIIILKEFLSNDLFQKILFKWFFSNNLLRIIFANNFFRAFQVYST